MTRGATIGLSVLAGVLGMLQVVGLLGVLLVRSVEDSFGGFEEGGFGVVEDLGALRERCADGDMVACDDLYFGSPIDSSEEAFGETCGDRNPPAPGQCTILHPELDAP